MKTEKMKKVSIKELIYLITFFIASPIIGMIITIMIVFNALGMIVEFIRGIK